MDDNLKSEIEKRVQKVIGEDENPTSNSFATLEGNGTLSLFPPDTYVHKLSVDGLRHLSYYLCKSQLFSSTNLSDNYHYWGWTLVCSTSIHFPDREFINAQEGVIQDIAGVLRLLYLRNLGSILQDIDQEKWKQSSEPEIPFELTLNRIAPSPHEIKNQFARAAFSTLEASLRRHCKEVDLTGEPLDDERYNTYIEDYTHRGKVKYEDLLNLWKDHNTNPATEKVLQQIQYIFEENERLKSEMEEIAEEYNFEGQGHDLFWLIRNVRNSNIHGK